MSFLILLIGLSVFITAGALLGARGFFDGDDKIVGKVIQGDQEMPLTIVKK